MRRVGWRLGVGSEAIVARLARPVVAGRPGGLDSFAHFALQFQPWQGRTKAITTTSVVGVTIDLENQSNIRTIDGCHHETGRGGYPRRSDTRLTPVPTCYNTNTHTQ